MSETILNHQSLISEYLESRELTATSKTTYRSIIDSFFRYLINNNRSAKQPMPKDAIAYKYSLEMSGKSVYTIILYMMTLRTFFTWLVESGYYNIIITKGIQRMKKKTSYAKLPLNRMQVAALLSKIDQTTIIGKRDALIINMALTTGLRVNELANVQIADITNTKIKVLRKGYTTKGQQIDFPESILPLIEDYIEQRNTKGEEVTSESYLFVSHTNGQSNRLKSNRISELIKGRLLNAGINNPKITAHSLRHTCACFLIEKDVELAVVQRYLGHSSITTTQLYTRFAEFNKLEQQKPCETLSEILKNISLPE